ncbi:hypothetical protein CORAM0001_1593 [Corynebacterium amycolatum SK46]|nr:hypothetical protein CORAM0001_1593 [Corynebacterium amycolatum SK46]
MLVGVGLVLVGVGLVLVGVAWPRRGQLNHLSMRYPLVDEL